MKPIFFAAITLLLAGCGTPIYVTTTTTAPPPEEIPAEGVAETNYQVFYDQLGPYGNWIDYPNYGYVWHPNVDADFRPYATNGHWVYNDEGWVWVSSYNWGWAPFHYGRWFFDDNYGWLWVPGHEWAPAWVTWGRTADYYCWAPLEPNVDADRWTPPQRAWNFVPGKRVTRPDLDKYVVNNTTIINQHITIINNTTRANDDHNRYGRNGNGNIQVGINNGQGTSTANPGNYNNRGNNNYPDNGNNHGNDNRGNDNRGNNNNNGNHYGRDNNNNPPNNNGNNNPNNGNGYGRNNNNPPNNNGNNNQNNGNGYGRNNNNPPSNNPNNNQPAQGGFNRGNNTQPVTNTPNPNVPSYNPQQRPASTITTPDTYRSPVNNNTAANQQQQPAKYNRGPGIIQVENTTNNRVQPVTIQDRNQPGQTTQNNNRVNMFRPRVVQQQQSQNGRKPAPGKVDSYKQQKPGNNQ